MQPSELADLNDMWNRDQCRDYGYRTGRNDVSAWLNNVWYALVQRYGAEGNRAPWTWDKRAAGRYE